MREKHILTTQQFILESWPDQTSDIQRASAEQVAQVQGILTNLCYQTKTPPPGFHNPPILSPGNISCTVSQLESGGLLQSPTAGIMQWQDQDIPMGTDMSVDTEQVIESQDITNIPQGSELGQSLPENVTNLIQQYMEKMARERFLPMVNRPDRRMWQTKAKKALPVHGSDEHEKYPILAKVHSMLQYGAGELAPTDGKYSYVSTSKPHKPLGAFTSRKSDPPLGGKWAGNTRRVLELGESQMAGSSHVTQTNMAAPTMGGIGIKSPRKSDDTALFRRYIDNQGKVQFSEVSVPMPENANSNAARPGKSPDYVETESNHYDADCDDDFDQISDTESPKDEHEQEVIDFRGRLKLVDR